MSWSRSAAPTNCLAASLTGETIELAIERSVQNTYGMVPERGCQHNASEAAHVRSCQTILCMMAFDDYCLFCNVNQAVLVDLEMALGAFCLTSHGIIYFGALADISTYMSHNELPPFEYVTTGYSWVV